jgi:hypothetical protein
MSRIRIYMTLIINELEPLSEGDGSADPNLESEEDKKLQGKAEHQAEADPQREAEPQGNAEPHGEAYQQGNTKSQEGDPPVGDWVRCTYFI